MSNVEYGYGAYDRMVGWKCDLCGHSVYWNTYAAMSHGKPSELMEWRQLGNSPIRIDICNKCLRDDLDRAARAICDSEAFMWLMTGSNHEEIQLDALREAYESYRKSGGGYGMV